MLTKEVINEQNEKIIEQYESRLPYTSAVKVNVELKDEYQDILNGVEKKEEKEEEQVNLNEI